MQQQNMLTIACSQHRNNCSSMLTKFWPQVSLQCLVTHIWFFLDNNKTLHILILIFHFLTISIWLPVLSCFKTDSFLEIQNIFHFEILDIPDVAVIPKSSHIRTKIYLIAHNHGVIRSFASHLEWINYGAKSLRVVKQTIFKIRSADIFSDFF